MFRFCRNKIISLCRRARSKHYANNVANTSQSNPRKRLSAVKNIAGLAPPINVSTLVYNGHPYSHLALANLFNDKFVAVGNFLPPLAWTPLEVDDFTPDFTFWLTILRRHYNLSNFSQQQALTKSRLGSSAKNLRFYVAH